MKGFYIEITNNLLEPKHREAMGESVWFYMWLLDKMTSVDENGIGKVLGGRPIKLEEVIEDLGVSQRTYSRYCSRLKRGGYIKTRRTPYGMVIFVNKAKKRFGQKSDTPHMAHPDTPHLTRDTPKVAGKICQNSLNKEDKTKRQDNRQDISSEQSSHTNEIITLFKDVNPTFERLYKHKTQRSAVERLVKKFGVEKITNTVKALAEVTGRKYAPRITTPLELERDLGKLITFYKQEKTTKGKQII
jgi:hypothetical protein